MKPVFIFLSLCLSFLFSCEPSAITLIRNGTSNYEIVLPGDASDSETASAKELQKYLKMASSVEIPISKEGESNAAHNIWLGNTDRGKALKPMENEVIIITDDNDLVIAGGDEKSMPYAVYTFLENYLGCRFYAPDAEVVPEKPVISMPAKLTYRYQPTITTRTVHSKLYYDHPDFAAKRKTTDDAFPNYVPSARVHTFHHFVPASIYYKKHPEYYALRNGKRIPTQLCLTNPDVLQIVKDTVASLLSQYPGSDVISVSQDDNQQYCQCAACTAINDAEASAAGSVIDFVNKIAGAFPDKTISTLAYQYTRTAPKHLKPRENVLITLCSIECDRSAPIAEKCTDFTDDLIAWGKLTDNIRIWDYTTQFTNFLAPFPNLHTLQPNIQLFRDNNAKWIFEQHSHQPSELFELRSYLTAKLLWDPDVNQDSIVSDFLHGYYQEAAPFIRNYITTIQEEIQKDSDFFLFLYGDPSQGFGSFLRPELLKRYDTWYNEAEQAIKNKPEILKRVRRARLSVDFAILEAARRNDPQAFSLSAMDANGTKYISPELEQRVARFTQTCEEAGITMMNEMRFSVEEYLEFYKQTMARAMKKNIAVSKHVELMEKPKKYANENPQTLTDGAFGGANFYANWLGFEGNNLEAVIDLGDKSEISQVSADFLQVVNHIVFFPVDVKYYYSNDGKNYTLLGQAKNKRPLSPDSKINDIQQFQIDFSPVSARFIRVVANNMGTAPNWHHGAGMPCWIFVDEVMVR